MDTRPFISQDVLQEEDEQQPDAEESPQVIQSAPRATCCPNVKKGSSTVFSLAKEVSVEVSALLYVTSAIGSALISQQLLLEKCCLYQLSYPEDVCSHLDAQPNQNAQNAVQKLAAKYNMYNSLFGYVVPVLVALFIGNWTDKYGRKSMIVFCFFTSVVQQVGLLLNIIYMEWNPIYMSLMSSLPFSFGAFTTFLMLVFSYMGDVTTTSQRTVRLSILNLFMYAGQPLGSLAGSAIYDRFGYNITIYYFMSVSVVGALYSCWKLDSKAHLRRQSLPGAVVENSNTYSDHSYKEKAKELFNVWENGKETLATFTKRRPGYNRAVLVLMGGSLLVSLLPIYGE
jgi:MFS family permease